MSDLTRLSAADLAARLAAREVSSVEATQAHLDRIAKRSAGAVRLCMLIARLAAGRCTLARRDAQCQLSHAIGRS